jgi:hypothetical protein
MRTMVIYKAHSLITKVMNSNNPPDYYQTQGKSMDYIFKINSKPSKPENHRKENHSSAW